MYCKMSRELGYELNDINNILSFIFKAGFKF